jgi:succinate dehydrogenase hydrophobic anchor subunit
MNSRKYIVGVVFVTLLIWGPIDHSWTLWFLIRGAYLVLIPILVWFLLIWLWSYWKPSIEIEDRFERALAGATSGVFFALSIIAATSKTHIGNTMSIQTRDGVEDVGDYILLQGANWGGALVFFILAAFAFWYSISKRESKL